MNLKKLKDSIDANEHMDELAAVWDDKIKSEYGIDFIDVFSDGDEMYFVPNCDPTRECAYLYITSEGNGLDVQDMSADDQLIAELADFNDVSEDDIKNKIKKWKQSKSQIISLLKKAFE